MLQAEAITTVQTRLCMLFVPCFLTARNESEPLTRDERHNAYREGFPLGGKAKKPKGCIPSVKPVDANIILLLAVFSLTRVMVNLAHLAKSRFMW